MAKNLSLFGYLSVVVARGLLFAQSTKAEEI